MERPLHFQSRYRNEFRALAKALLYAEQSVAAHEEVLGGVFVPLPATARLRALARRTQAWTALRPQPRARAVVEQLRADKLVSKLLERHVLRPPSLPIVPCMRVWPGLEGLPAVATVGQLAAWLRIDVPYLEWMADLGDRNRRQSTGALQHYRVRAVAKSGGFRLLEAPKQNLRHVQREILRGILDQSPPHDAVHGFRKGRSILTFAAPHAGREVVLRLDLKDFFPSIPGARVQAMFRTLGYPERVADLLGGLCTTTTPSSVWSQAGCELARKESHWLRGLYARPHLPQGGPTSPAVANLCALRLDRRLAGLAAACGAVYTRYADDLAFSGDGAFLRGAGRFATQVAATAAEEGFHVQHRKTRLMRASVRQHLAGLTVNAKPAVPRRELDRMEAVLTNCVRYGPASQNREGHPDFRAHLAGKVAFVAMVRPERAVKLRALLERIVWG